METLAGTRQGAPTEMSRILRLFAIRKETEQQHMEIYFSDQMIARRVRDKFIAETNEPHVVCYGPDHKRYKTNETQKTA